MVESNICLFSAEVLSQFIVPGFCMTNSLDVATVYLGVFSNPRFVKTVKASRSSIF